MALILLGETKAKLKKEYLTIKELPVMERPYEKCEKYGAAVLSDAELLAVIIRTGSYSERAVDLAARIISISPMRGINELHHLSMKELLSIRGIGRVKALQLLCIAELAKRMARTEGMKGIVLDRSSKVADYYMENMRHLDKEQLMVVYLDSKLRMISDKIMFMGSIGMSIMEPREILIDALKQNAVNIIILHNHPSGDPTPSYNDIIATKRLIEAANMVGFTIADHVIIGDKKYISLFEQKFV